MFLARKITRAKWVDAHLNSGEIPADAVTVDLRTRNNTLSFWQCGDATEEELDEAVLALAAAAQRVESIDIVWLSYDELRTDGQRLDVTAGLTPVAELAERHVDLSLLDYVRLGRVADRVAAALNKGRHRRLTRPRVVDILARAVQQRRVDLSDLQEKVRSQVEAR